MQRIIAVVEPPVQSRGRFFLALSRERWALSQCWQVLLMARCSSLVTLFCPYLIDSVVHTFLDTNRKLQYNYFDLE
jgi:hypothetical protein